MPAICRFPERHNPATCCIYFYNSSLPGPGREALPPERGGTAAAKMLSARLPVLQPIGTDPLPRTTVAGEVEKHLGRTGVLQRRLPATRRAYIGRSLGGQSTCTSFQHILTDISCTADRDDPLDGSRTKSGTQAMSAGCSLSVYCGDELHVEHPRSSHTTDSPRTP